MLLAAYACLPPSLQAHVAADLRAEVHAHTAAAPAGSDRQWQELLNALNPVLTWDPAANTLVLSSDGWQQLLQFTRPHLRPASAAVGEALLGQS